MQTRTQKSIEGEGALLLVFSSCQYLGQNVPTTILKGQQKIGSRQRCFRIEFGFYLKVPPDWL